MPDTFQKLTAEEFMECIVSRETNAVVEVGAEWSGSSQVVLNTLTSVVNNQQSKLNVYQIDSEINPFIHKLYNLDALPAGLLFRKGILVDKLSGLTSRASKYEKIEKHYNA